MPKIPAFPSWLLTFVCVVIALVYFGANSVSAANARMVALFNPHLGLSITNLLSPALLVDGLGIRFLVLPLLVGVLISFFGPSSEQLGRDFRPTPLNCVGAAGLTVCSFLIMNSTISTPFIYFRF
jgi:hypothetical protein